MSLRDLIRADAPGDTGTTPPPSAAVPLQTAIPVTPEAAARAAALDAVVPRLTTPRCVLRAPRLADFDALYAITAADRDGFMGGPTTPEESWGEFCAMAATWLLRGHGMWAVEHERRIAGFVVIGTEPGDVEHELGWLFLKACRGRGLASEAAVAARDHAWTALRLPSLVSYVAVGNAASERLADRLGAVPDGLAYDGQVTVWRHPRPECLA